jgi:protein ImuA
LVTCHRGQLQTLSSEELGGSRSNLFSTGLPAVDGLLPGGGLARAAVHEVLHEAGSAMPLFFAMVLARAASGNAEGSTLASASAEGGASHRPVVWCDPEGFIYSPALAAAGIYLDQVYFLRPKNPRDLIWAMSESLRCPGVGVAIAAPAKLSRIEARRLQLAAETGGTAGVLLRTFPRREQLPPYYAAATRWLVRPAAGEANVQRWKIRLVHCHGGDTRHTFILEHCRDTNSVRAVSELAHRFVHPRTAGA